VRSLSDRGAGRGLAQRAALWRRIDAHATNLDALGFERAVILPEQMGNILLLPSEVEAALAATRRAYSGLSPEKIFRGRQVVLRLQRQ
jgi:hypothetical protein